MSVPTLNQEAEQHRRLVRFGRVMAARRGPLLDDKAAGRLQDERTADVQQIERGVGAARCVLRIVLREVVAQDRRGTRQVCGDRTQRTADGTDQPSTKASWAAIDSMNVQASTRSVPDAYAAQLVRSNSEEQAAGAHGDGHDAQELDDAGAIDAVDVLQPRRSP